MPITKRSPSRASASMLGRSTPSSRLGGVSCFRIAKRKTAETAKLIASRNIAKGAPKMPIRPPAVPGPASCEVERLISSFELPSTSCSRSTSEGRYDWYATSKKTVQIPTRKATT